MTKNNNLMRLLFLIIITVLSVECCYAQKPDDVKLIQQQYPDANAVLLLRKEKVEVTLDNNAIKATSQINEQILINKEEGVKYQTRSVSTGTFIEATNIKAYTQVPNTKKYDKLNVDKFELKDATDRNVFYDDAKEYTFIYPAAQTGSILNLTYTEVYKEPRFLGGHSWSYSIPSVYNELSIKVSKGINIEFKLFNTDDLGLEYSKIETKTDIVYTWILRNKKPKAFYDNAPNSRYYIPHILYYITDYEVNGNKKTLLGTPKNLYNWYVSLQKNLNKTENIKLKAIADSLVANCSTELQKVQNIFYWVQDNIAYVAFEDGLGGFVPRDAGTVYNRKYGDCKDMASIIKEMLRMVGVNAYLSWLGSRDIPYSYTEVPTPAVDNHMIASYYDNTTNKWLFLDATGKKAPLNLTTSFIQSKEVLIGINNDSFAIAKVPIQDTSISQTIDTVIVTALAEGIIKGKGKLVLTGYNALDYRYRTEFKNKKDALEYFKNYAAKGNNKISYTAVEIINTERKPIEISYLFELPDYAKNYDKDIYINLNLNKEIVPEKTVKDRKTPIAFDNKNSTKLLAQLNIPKGYTVGTLPDNIKFENDVMGFRNNYVIKNNTIYYTTTFYVNKLIVPEIDFEKYNAVITEYNKAVNQSLTLIKTN